MFESERVQVSLVLELQQLTVNLFHHSAACFIIFHEYEWSSCDPHEYQTNKQTNTVLLFFFSSQLIAAAGGSSTHDAPGETFTVTVVVMVRRTCCR